MPYISIHKSKLKFLNTMKKLTLILALAVVFTGVSFAQSSTQPIKPTPNQSKYPHKKKSQVKKDGTKTEKTTTTTPAAK